MTKPQKKLKKYSKSNAVRMHRVSRETENIRIDVVYKIIKASLNELSRIMQTASKDLLLFLV